MLHIGCADELEIENELSSCGTNFISDRLDIESRQVSHPNLGQQWKASVENMVPVATGQYDAAVANWVLEHVADLNAAAGEIFRVLKRRGRLFVTCPNPRALEFRLSRHTPLAFHQVFSTHRAYETHYSYQSIEALTEIFEKKGFRLRKANYQPAYELYLWRYPVINVLARGWDWVLCRLSKTRLRGHVFICFEKP